MPRETFGDLLRRERERRGLSIDAAAETVGADPAWLRALERNDFVSLPDEATMRACLERYAVCLEVEADLMIADYDRERERFLRADEERTVEGSSEKSPQKPPEKPPEEPARKPGEKRVPPGTRVLIRAVGAGTERRSRIWLPLLMLLLVAVTLVAAGAGGLLRWRNSSDEGPPPAPRPEAPSELDRDPIGPRTSSEPPVEPPAEVPRIYASPAGVAPSEVFPPDVTTTEPTTSEAPTSETQAAPSPALGSRLTITEHGVGTGVDDRQLVGRGERFPAGSRVWYWTRVLGGSNGDRIDHVWLRDGVEASRITLRIGAPTWRTFSATALPTDASSDWAVEARDESGAVLARSEFVSVR